MSRINVHCELRYTVTAPTSFSFAVLAARNPHQQVIEEQLIITPELATTRTPLEPSGHDLVRLVAEPGPLWLLYDATVELSAFVPRSPRRSSRRSPTCPPTSWSTCTPAATASPTCSPGWQTSRSEMFHPGSNG